jgi:hypothetical protein
MAETRNLYRIDQAPKEAYANESIKSFASIPQNVKDLIWPHNQAVGMPSTKRSVIVRCAMSLRRPSRARKKQMVASPKD